MKRHLFLDVVSAALAKQTLVVIVVRPLFWLLNSEWTHKYSEFGFCVNSFVKSHIIFVNKIYILRARKCSDRYSIYFGNNGNSMTLWFFFIFSPFHLQIPNKCRYKNIFFFCFFFRQAPVEVKKRLEEVRLLESRRSARLADQERDTDFAKLADMANDRRRASNSIDVPMAFAQQHG